MIVGMSWMGVFVVRIEVGEKELGLIGGGFR